MIKINLEIKGDKATIAKLRKLGAEFNDWSGTLKRIGEYLLDFYQNSVFESEGNVYGTRWALLRPNYDFWKRTQFGGRGILQRTGTLRAGFYMKPERNQVEIRNEVPYAQFHQTGTRRMPARILTQVDRARKEQIIKLFKIGVAEKIRKVL